MSETKQEASPVMKVADHNAPLNDPDVCNETTCMFEGKEYGEGSEICMANYIHVCRGGQWVSTSRYCGPGEGG
ncbi:hypothetical protein [Streptomyces yanii]|uniref:hypothetical protein n=1 Tax=Streptomyces yanii TaxID=78510 RepID=UPI0031EA6374